MRGRIMNYTLCYKTLRIIAIALLVSFCALLIPAEAGHRNARNVEIRNTTQRNFSNNRNVNYNRNVNVHRDIDVDVNRHYHGGYYGGCCYYDRPGVGAVVAATAAAIVVGTIVSSLPPNCTTIVANGFTYHNCGGTYYQPRYAGGSVTYVVVNRP
jgi:hypothetical protein